GRAAAEAGEDAITAAIPQHAMTEHAITDALGEWRAAVPGALERLVPLVYAELSRIAHRQLGAEAAGHTLSTSELVHEAYFRLGDQTRTESASRAQFFGLAAHTMRRVRIDYARRHQAARRGGSQQRPVSLDVAAAGVDAGALAIAARGDELLALDEALDRLAVLDPRQARVVECRFYGGLTETETAEVLGVTPRTVARDWVKARGWLSLALRDDPR
ncbi:MAG TPA: ECF-type sigma factor, partial [Gemmatirosa sp.]